LILKSYCTEKESLSSIPLFYYQSLDLAYSSSPFLKALMKELSGITHATDKAIAHA